MDRWTLLRRYQGLTRLGQALPLACANCDNDLVTMLGKDDEPVLWCPYCDNTFDPGSTFWADVTSVVNEHHLE